MNWSSLHGRCGMDFTRGPKDELPEHYKAWGNDFHKEREEREERERRERRERYKDFNWFEVTGDLLTIRFSDEEPMRAIVRIFYRDTWFYIDDSDMDSKSTFSLLTQIYALQSGAIKSIEPILTIGVGS